MAHQFSQAAKDILTRLATNPQLLVDFIKDPEGVLKNNNIQGEEIEIIRNTVAAEVAKKLVVHPRAYIHWGT